MNWFLVALLPPALWSVSNHFDKYLLAKYFKGGGVGALMVFSSIIGLLLLPLIAALHPAVLTTFNPKYLLISLNGFFYVLAVLPYFYALQKGEASVAVSLFQLIPVYSYVLGFFILGERLKSMQLVGGAVVVAGAILMSLDIVHLRKIRLKWDIFLLMSLSSFLYAINFLFFKFFSVSANFWVTSFWEYIGFAVFAGLLLIFVKHYREEFITVVKKNKVSVLSINGINEAINIIAKVAFNFASLLAPVTLIWIVNGLQPFFVFLYGIIITIFFPKISQEDIGHKALIQKILAIIIMFIGITLVNQK